MTERWTSAHRTVPPSTTDSFAIFPIEGTQVVRVPADDSNKAPDFAVRCCCGFKGGPFAVAATAEVARADHAASCLWPKP